MDFVRLVFNQMLLLIFVRKEMTEQADRVYNYEIQVTN